MARPLQAVLILNDWRIIDSGPGGAGWNMAVDEALLLLAGEGKCLPTLRFFTWEAPSLSLGSFQKVDELDLDGIHRRGVPLVRRPTGGRAVLHDAELTYSVTCPIPSPFFPSELMGSYKVIGACFMAGLGHLGINAELLPIDKSGSKYRPQNNPLCFSSPSWYEVLLGGKKLIGSAQRRLRNAFLQQGSLLIGLDIDGLISMLRFRDEDARRKAREALKVKMTALNEHGYHVGLDELKDGLVQGFSEALGTGFVPGELTAEEIRFAEELLETKYSRDEWNLYRQTSR
jgi:lipoate-protein ligase A